MLTRRWLITLGLGLSMLASGCAKEAGPVDAGGQPLESLIIVTASGEHRFMVEIADDDAERERGLMFRPPLDADRGMLFEFPDAEERGFWMKNTPSSLDIIYIDPTGRIVSIAHHTTPFSESVLPSNGAANGVLELRAGRAEEIQAVPGSTVKHPFFVP